MIMYKLFKDIRSQEINSVFRTDDNGQIWSIPFAPDNTDYQAYLKWVSEGGVPTPADE
jgi:hypothetical protein